MKKTFYVTTPIYYPNDVPHIGHAYTTIAADALARWKRLAGFDVFFVTGIDEHGQKIENAAKDKGVKPKEFVDKLLPVFKNAWKVLDVEYNRFIRTSDKDHEEAVKQIILKVHKNKDIYKGMYEGWYCTPCETFLTETQLIDEKCPECKRGVHKLKEESYFFRLSKYQQRLLDFYNDNPEFLSPSSRSREIINRVEEGLNDLSITRTSFRWGIPFPLDDKHITYVWFDALTNYISAIGYPSQKFEKYWPADVHIIGKEINWFHSVIWPAMLMSAGIELPKKVFAHGWLTIEGEKMSKSKGNFIEPKVIVEKYGVDAFRYFMLREIPFGDDGNFSEHALIMRINTELANELGNLVMRTNKMIHRYFDGVVPEQPEHKPEEIDEKLIEASKVFKEADSFMGRLEFHKAIEAIWQFVRAANKYINETEPWRIQDKKRLAAVLYNLTESLRIITILIDPFMPSAAAKIRKQMNFKEQDFSELGFGMLKKHKINSSEMLFEKKELGEAKGESKSKQKAEPEAKPAKHKANNAEFPLDLKVGIVEQIENHPSAENLYTLQINLGKETRQLVAGLRQFIEKKDILGKRIIVVANLKPATFRGIESNGMLLAAEKNNKVVLLEAPESEPGSKVVVKGYKTKTEQITIEDFSKIKLAVKNKHVFHNGKELKTGKEKVVVDIENDAIVR